MALCTKCGVSHPLPELTNYNIPVPLDASGKPLPDETERLCFRCVREELECVQKQAAAMRSDLEQCRAFVARFLVPWRHHLSESWLSGFEEAGCVVFDSIGFVKPKPIDNDAGTPRNSG